VLPAPDWTPPDRPAERLAAFAERVARELKTARVPPSRDAGNHWVISYDVYEAVWYPADARSWAVTHGRLRDGWSHGSCLLLFQTGQLAQGNWFGVPPPQQ